MRSTKRERPSSTMSHAPATIIRTRIDRGRWTPALDEALTQRIAPGSSNVSVRNASAAVLRLGACSACATTASRVSRAPGSRAARQSGNRLKVVWLSGQYQRAIRVPRAVLTRLRELEGGSTPQGLDFVLEVVSRGTWREDRDETQKVHASLGAEEYWLYDPTGEQLASRIRGMRLVGGEYRDFPPVASGFGVRKLRSAVLGLDVGVDRDGAASLRPGDRQGASGPCSGACRSGSRRGADCGA